MTTGATGQLGLALPVQGELSGTWGDTVNNGITQYTNIAIAGTLTLTGDGAVTLANTTGDASASNITSTLAGAGTVTAQFAIVKVSGTTTTKVVTGPSYSKTYVVDNASSFAVTFKASGQTGVSIAAAEKVTVVFNGTDYIKLAGTIANAAGSNTQLQFNSSGVFGASANLTWDGTTLSSTQVNITGQGTLRLQDTTGGEYVGLRSPGTLGASYTLTFPADDGTSGQALITDGSGVLSWSTAASGDVYGPGSSTDNAVARFDSTTGKLLQNSVVIIGDTGDVSGVGTLSAATLTLTNALGTAYGGTGLTSFTSGGVVYASSTSALATGSALTFDGTNLTTTGTANANVFKTSYTGGNLSLDTTSASYARVGGSTSMGWNAGTQHIWELGGIGAPSEQMRLTSTGLGIGTSSPQGKLQVGSPNSSGSITIPNCTIDAQSIISGNSNSPVLSFNAYNSSYGMDLWVGTTGLAPCYIDIRQNESLIFRRNTASGTATETMRLDSAGNLGLGVTPSAWGQSGTLQAIQIKSTAFAGAGTNAYWGSNWFGGGFDKYIATATASASLLVQTGGAFLFNTAGAPTAHTAGDPISFTQAMTLDASGNLVVGATVAEARLQASTSNPTNGVVQLLQNLSLSSQTGAKTQYDVGNVGTSGLGIPNGTSNALAFFVGGMTSASERARIDSSGNFLVGTTSSSWGTKLVVYNNQLTVTGGGYDGTYADSIFFGGNSEGTTYRNKISNSISASATLQLMKFSVASGSSTWVEALTLRGDGAIYTGLASQSPYNLTTGNAANANLGADGYLRRSTSSLKYKTDVQDTTHGLEKVMALRPVTYKGKNDGDTVFGGLIAEEVHAVGLTEFVQYAEDGSPDALAYGNMISLAFKAIQEQQAIIESLKARLDAANL